jgi:hypothetical protein
MECRSNVIEELWAERRAKLSKLRPVTDNQTFQPLNFDRTGASFPGAAVVQDVSGNHQSFE